MSDQHVSRRNVAATAAPQRPGDVRNLGGLPAGG
jgi:hypothetical protein